ncbi:MAG: SLBB domain-containing protein, partial [Gammaproteobacteria bacterium]
MRWLERIVAGCLLAVLAAPLSAQPPELPTAEQLERLEQLNPEQRKALADVIRKKEGIEVKEEPPEEPVLVTPLERRPEEPEAAEWPDRHADWPDRHAEDESEAGFKELPRTGRRKAPEQELNRFGYDLFAGVPTTFAPATDIPVGPDYVIGPGDTVQIQLFGKEPAEYALVVSRDGTLQFPGIGPIPVAGLSFADMEEVIATRVEEQTIGNRVSVTMGPLRSIRVFVLGDASRPGSYTVSALTTMTNALFVSGGINPIGSLRDIQLKRRGRVVARLDLYDLLLRGDTSGDARLQPGDVIFIPPVGATVGVDGEVRRPAIYELDRESTVEEVVELAGGLLPTAYPPATQIERIDAKGERTLVDLDIGTAAGQRTRVREGDVVQVYSVLEKMKDIVLLTGHVERPGAYQWREGMRVSDLVPSIEDHLLARPDLEYALIRRELRPDRRLQLLSVRLGDAVQNPSSAANLALQPRDELMVFGFNEERGEVIEPLIEELKEAATYQRPARVVRVGGLVRLSGDYPLEPGMRVSDLIRAG